jgi:hypothetical protein
VHAAADALLQRLAVGAADAEGEAGVARRKSAPPSIFRVFIISSRPW